MQTGSIPFRAGKQTETQSVPEQVPERDARSGGNPRIPASIEGIGLGLEDLIKLGQSHRERFRNLGELEDINKAIEYGSRALGRIPDNYPELSRWHADLGVSYTDRFQRLGDLKDLEKAIEHDICALASTPDGHPDLSRRHAALGVSYSDRFHRLGDVDDLEKAVEHDTRALALTPDGHSDSPSRHAALGVSYINRFRRLGDMNDLEQSIEHRAHALALTPGGDPSLGDRYAALGVPYIDRFRRLGDLDDIEKAIEHLAHALALTPDGHPDLADRHAALGVPCTDRYRRLGGLEDLEQAIKHFTRAVTLTPDDHPDSPSRHAALGVSYIDRFRRLGDLDDLEKSITHKLHALKITPEGHPDLSERHANLGVSYKDRFQRLGKLDDLEESIKHGIHALTLTPDDHPALAHRHAALAGSYVDRFERLGDLDDIETAIEHDTCALALTPDGHQGMADRHANLGLSYTHQFGRLGDPASLDKSIEHKTHALQLTPSSDPDLSHRHADLGISYGDRFQRLGDLDDLDEAIYQFSCALALTPHNHPELSSRYGALGATYADRFQRLGNLDDLETSIEHRTCALAMTPDDHPQLSDRHTALGLSYTDKFQQSADLDDLKKLIEHDTRALALTPDGHPDLPMRQFNRAHTFVLQYQHTGESFYLNHSLDYFRKSSQALVGSPRNRFKHALEWANISSEHNILDCIEAYRTTIDLLPQFIWLGATTTQRYHDLSVIENLAMNAASAAIRRSEPNLALEWLEHARCVVWNQSTMLRSPVDELQSCRPHLAARLQEVAKQLNNGDFGSSVSRTLSPNSFDPELVARQRRHLAQEYHDLLTQTRKIPEFQDFLRPARFDRLVRAARNGSVVIINCGASDCDAIIIPNVDNEIHCIPLPNFSRTKAQDAAVDIRTSLRHQGIRQRGAQLFDDIREETCFQDVLKTLWLDVIKPVLDFLGYTNKPPIDNLPHVTWCPTGPVSFLPLHAAGDYDEPHSRVFEYVISSYTPTLTALLSTSPSTLSREFRVLGVGQEATTLSGYNLSKLPGTTEELRFIKERTSKMHQANFTELTGSQATKDAVLDAMESHDWVHLACHAHQNVGNATESGFFLHDGILDLASINRRSFKNKGLAFLSACQTAKGDDKLPDEAIHLASGMLMAGYPSVIATMWSVDDQDAPLVADKVYAELIKDGKIGNGEAGRALHNAVAALRDGVGEKDFARWVPFIHIGS